MSGLWGHLVGVLILALMTTFIAIWIWAWRPRHRRTFDALAAIPMLDNRAAADERRGGNGADDAAGAGGAAPGAGGFAP